MPQTLHPCCDPKSPSQIWEGTPTGKIIDIEGIEAYLSQTASLQPSQNTSRPEHDPKRIILFLAEGHGIYLPNAQLLADSFSSYLNLPVLMPDQFSRQARLPKFITPSIPSGSALSIIPLTTDPSDPNYENRGLAPPLKENIDSSDAWPFLKPP